jgi:hypothetical protein
MVLTELDECACLSELLFKKGSIFSMPPVEMHLKSFGKKLEFVTEPFRQHTRVLFGVHDLSTDGVGRCRDELLDLDE